jgi:acyl carrier protein phosphodiesterase
LIRHSSFFIRHFPAYNVPMNLLAHILLSPPDDDAMLVGNLTADWVKGKARRALPASIQAGMALHQRIDIFTDTHPHVDACTSLLSPRWHRYAPVLVDILFDHVLSCEWPHFCDTPRPAVIARAYAALRAHVHLLPDRARLAAASLLADDWLSCYATLDGIALSLSRLSQRLHHSGHTVELAPAVHDFRTHREAFHHAFRHFFPALRQHIAHHAAAPVDMLPVAAVH